MHRSDTPRIVAFCGAPGAGKTEAAKILVNEFDAIEIDSGLPLRDFCQVWLGATEIDVYTQEGKMRPSTLPGLSWRDVMGKTGAALETVYPDMLVHIALQRCKGDALYIVTGIRRQGAELLKKHGAKLVEIVRPGFEVINDFDQYDRNAVDLSITNSGSLDDFRRELLTHFA